MLCSSSNIGEFSKDVRMLAALEETESDGDKLLDAARRLAGAFSELLTAAQPGSAEVSAVTTSRLIKQLLRTVELQTALPRGASAKCGVC